VSWNNLPARTEGLRGARVLVIEDEPLIALDLRSLLGIEGAEVLGPACSLAEGLRLAGGGDVDVALLDVRIGSETAIPIAEALRERGVPFAFYTGQIECDALRRDWPEAPVIAKPSPARQLVAAIERLCRPSVPPRPANGQARPTL
jgi:DNA-binding response OmpR family regulator